MPSPVAKAALALLFVGAFLLVVAPGAVAAPLAPNATYALPGPSPLDYSDVVLLGNNNSQASRNLTLHFQQVHNMSSNNVIFADLPDAESISEAQWNVFAPWFKGEMANRSLGSSINYLVTFKGIPIRVYWTTAGGPSSFQDALMLLGGSYEGYIGDANLYPNPYFDHTEAFTFAQFGIRLVTGIYAYNESTAMALIDRAANAIGSRGEFVLDADASKGFLGGHGSYGYANGQMTVANQTLSDAGWPTYFDTNNTYVTGRVGVMGYSSWGSNDCCWGAVTQLALPHNTWVNGSIGETFVSTGARTFTWPPSYGQSLIADWIDEGANAMKGYTDEPYINAIADASILYGRYVEGYTMAESYWAASHFVGWRQIVIGDPKMAAYSDIGNLAANASLSSAPPWAVQFSSVNVTFGVDNTATVSKVAKVHAGWGLYGLGNWTVELPAWSSASFDFQLDLSLIPASGWGFQYLGLSIDWDYAIDETEEQDNSWDPMFGIYRLPVASAQLDSASVLTDTPVSLLMGTTRADRSIVTFEMRMDAGPADPFPAVGGAAQATAQFNRSGTHTFWVAAVDTEGLRSAEVGPLTLVVLDRGPLANLSVNTTNPLSLDPVRFDASASLDPDGTIASYDWNVPGVGNGTGAIFDVAFPTPGAYNVTLTVTDDEGASAWVAVQIQVRNRAPLALLVANVTEALTLVSIDFVGAGSVDLDGSIVSYHFDFDDGALWAGLSASVQHQFLHAGVQGAWLTVTDDWGATARSRVTVDVQNRAPTVAWEAGAGTGVSEGLAAWFKANGVDPDGEIVSFTLDFGDGRRVTRTTEGAVESVNEAHTYSVEGSFTAVLTIVDDLGDATVLRLSVNVTHPAPTVIGGSAVVEDGFLTVTYSTTTPYGPLQLEIELNETLWRSVDIETSGTYRTPLGVLPPGNYTFVAFVSDGVKRSEVANETFSVADTSNPPPPPPPPPPPGNFSQTPNFVLIVVGVAGAAGGVLLFMVMRRRRRA